MKKFRRDANRDLQIVDRRFVLTTSEPEAVTLKIEDAFAVCQGEFDLDERAGFPYYPNVLGEKNPDLGVVRSLYLRKLASVQGVRGASVGVSLAANRHLTVDGSVITEEGSELSIRDGQIFETGAE